jgi:hypothetical protein
MKKSIGTMTRRAALIGAAVLIAGCAATGIKHEELAKSMPAIKAGEGRIYFMRSDSMFGAAVQPDIKLNGQVVGQSKPGGFFYVDRPAGNYAATSATETEKSLTFALQAGETKYVRSSVQMGVMVGRVVLDLETPEKAKTELAGLSYTGAGK